MVNILNYPPGALVTILLETLNDMGVREDGYSVPVVSRLMVPDLSESMLYPLNMVRISTGLYYHRFTLPTGAVAVGSYIVDLSWTTAANEPKQGVVQVVCSSAGGSYSVSPT
jgi:hypothetical protein